jgi:hypothetical protein
LVRWLVGSFVGWHFPNKEKASHERWWILGYLTKAVWALSAMLSSRSTYSIAQRNLAMCGDCIISPMRTNMARAQVRNSIHKHTIECIVECNFGCILERNCVNVELMWFAEKDIAKAREIYQEIARCYLYGIGVEKNKSEAKAFLSYAAQLKQWAHCVKWHKGQAKHKSASMLFVHVRDPSTVRRSEDWAEKRAQRKLNIYCNQNAIKYHSNQATAVSMHACACSIGEQLFVKRILRILFSKRKILTLTMTLNIRDIKIIFKVNNNRYGLGLDLSPARIGGQGKLLCKFACRVRGLSGWAPTNDEIEVIACAARENRLAWLDLTENKITRITKPLCELGDLQWLSLEGMWSRSQNSQS